MDQKTKEILSQIANLATSHEEAEREIRALAGIQSLGCNCDEIAVALVDYMGEKDAQWALHVLRQGIDKTIELWIVSVRLEALQRRAKGTK